MLDAAEILWGQSQFRQRQATSPPMRTKLPEQVGHLSGKTNGVAHGGRLAGTAATMAGITSPARSTMTLSPMRRSFLAMSSPLCSVADRMVVPPRLTGRQIRHGARTPLRPTHKSSGGNGAGK
jgi:hypothetical protein